MSARDMAARYILVTRRPPRSFMFSSPTRPLDRLMMMILRSSMAFLKSNDDTGWPIIFLIRGLAVNCPTLFWIAGTASCGHALAIIGEFFRPESFDRRILDLRDDLLAVVLVGEHAIDAEQEWSQALPKAPARYWSGCIPCGPTMRPPRSS